MNLYKQIFMFYCKQRFVFTVNKEAKVGDQVICHFHHGDIDDTFEIVIGKLTRIDDDYPSGSIDNIEYDFASEGHTSTIFKITSENEQTQS